MRKLATALAVSIALSSSAAHALSLGEIEMRSALNQPMQAEIQLSSVRAGEMTGMIVKLASPEAFARAGIERTDALADLRFSVDQQSQTIVITSRRPIVEPFLNFLLEVDWPAGRMVREYTVLLDPPVFMTPNTSSRVDTAADSPALVQRDGDSLVTPTPILRDSDVFQGEVINLEEDPAIARAREAGRAAAARAAAGDFPVQPLTADSGVDLGGEVISLNELGSDISVTEDLGEVISLTELDSPQVQNFPQLDESGLPTVELIGGGQDVASDVAGTVTRPSSSADSVTVQRGDTLGTIADRLAGNGVSAQQMMMALLAANESAFINGNINLVRAGANLRVPSASEASAISQAEALASISDQNRLWQEYRDGVQSGQRATQVARASQAAAASTAGAASGGAAQDSAAPSATDLGLSDSSNTLSADAAAILENARSEVLRRDELSIVADNESTTTAASATSDESASSDADRLGEINRKLQLAREELASSRRESEDLGDQSAALQSTGENLDTLVTLQQNDIAKLEAQLEAAKTNTADSAVAASAESADTATGAVSDAANGVSDTLADAGENSLAMLNSAGDSVGDTLANAADSTRDAAGNLTDSASGLLSDTTRSASDTLQGGAEQLESVELIADPLEMNNTSADAAGSSDTAAATTPTEPSQSWLDGVMGSNLKWIPIGLGGLFGLGLLGTLFLGRRKKDIDERDLDDVEFIDEFNAVEDSSDFDGFDDDHDRVAASGSNASKVGVGAAAAAAGAAGAAALSGRDDAEHDFDNAHAGLSDADETTGFAGDADEIDPDDTISEVDVYLAYGLHGQAEELLTKAIDRDSDNPDYHAKLLETYAAQGNAEGYNQAAAGFQAKFGDSHPAWSDISSRGNELDPGNALYSGAAATVAAMGAGQFDDAPRLGDDDFASDESQVEIASMNRGFDDDASANVAMPELDSSTSDDGEDESHLMDQSIDPAFAFDEADLEATGDFSQIANEIAADVGDDTGSLDFPSLEGVSDSVSDAASGLKDNVTGIAGGAAAAAAGVAGTIGGKADDAVNEIDFDATSIQEHDFSELGASAEDLTLDLNQLSGDLELDSTELLDDSLEAASLDLSTQASTDDMLLSGTENFDSVDEMDTMMDLAKAYIDMGDNDSASSALDEIVKSGNPEQVSEAETLKRKIS